MAHDGGHAYFARGEGDVEFLVSLGLTDLTLVKTDGNGLILEVYNRVVRETLQY